MQRFEMRTFCTACKHIIACSSFPAIKNTIVRGIMVNRLTPCAPNDCSTKIAELNNTSIAAHLYRTWCTFSTNNEFIIAYYDQNLIDL